MSIIIDIVVALILICSIYGGYKKGIVNVGFKLIVLIASILISLLLYRPITDLIINNTDIDERIESIIIEKGIISNKDDESNNQNNNENSSESSIMEKYIQKYTTDLAKEANKAVVETTAKSIAINIVGIGVIIILFLSSRIIFTIIKAFTDIITNIPVIKQLNEVAGIIYGLLIGLIIIYVVLAIAFFALPISGNAEISSIIEKTTITKFFYENNILLNLMF